MRVLRKKQTVIYLNDMSFKELILFSQIRTQIAYYIIKHMYMQILEILEQVYLPYLPIANSFSYETFFSSSTQLICPTGDFVAPQPMGKSKKLLKVYENPQKKKKEKPKEN